MIGIIFDSYTEKNMKILFIAFTLLSLFACKNSKELTEQINTQTDSNGESVQTDNKPQRPYSVVARIGKFSESDEINIQSAEIEGNILTLQVSYTGGCAAHTFDFIGSAALMKSLPPKRSVKLVHSNGNDQCESIVNSIVQVDLSELAYTKETGSEVVLMLEGFNSPLTYIFQ